MEAAVDPIRLKVRYKNDRELLTEYTSSITRGGCLIHTPKRVPIGTEFIFEMQSDLNLPSTEVRGRVVRVVPRDNDFEVAVQYQSDEQTRQALEVVLMRVMVDPNREYVRQQPRIPVNLVCNDDVNAATRYLVKDMSMGGMGLALSAGKELPTGIENGTLAVVTVCLDDEAKVKFKCHVAWVKQKSPGSRATFGLQFHSVNDGQRMVLFGMLHLMRPANLLLHFEVGQIFAGGPVAAPPPERPLLLDLPLIAMQCAAETLSRFTGATLSGKKAASRSMSVQDQFFSVGVGLTGAQHGEIWLTTEPPFAAQIAKAYLGEDDAAPEVIRDALCEMLSTIAGQAGDALEAHGYLIDVTPPIDSAFHVEMKPGEQRFTYRLEGANQPLELVVITLPTATATDADANAAISPR